MRSKKGSKTTALAIRIKTHEEETSNKPELTPFAEFIGRLLSQTSEKTSIRTTWHHFPILEAVIAGLWLVTKKMAGHLGIPEDDRDAMLEAEVRTDQFTNIGLLLKYQNMGKAAEDFEKRVITPINRALALGLKPSTEVEANAWKNLISGDEKAFLAACKRAQVKPGPSSIHELTMLPAALFFADITKAGREHVEQLQELSEKYAHQNRVVIGGIACVLSAAYEKDISQLTGEYLTGKDHRSESGLYIFGKAPTRETYQMIVDTRREIEERLRWQEIVQRMPIRRKMSSLGFLPFELRKIDFQWLRTQILLAAAKKPLNEEALDLYDYQEVLTVLQKKEDATILGDLRSRFALKGVEFSEVEWNAVVKVVSEYITNFRKTPTTSISGTRVLELLLIVPPEIEVYFGRVSAHTTLDIQSIRSFIETPDDRFSPKKKRASKAKGVKPKKSSKSPKNRRSGAD